MLCVQVITVMPTSTSGLAAAEEGECHIPLRLLFRISELYTEDGVVLRE